MKKYISFDVATRSIGVAEKTIHNCGKETWELRLINLEGDNKTDSQVEKIKTLIKGFTKHKGETYVSLALETSAYKGNPTIERFIGVFMALCVGVGKQENIMLIQPTSGQSCYPEFKDNTNVKGAKVRGTKIISMKLASELVGVKIDNDDVADAILITHAMSKGGIKDNSIKHREVNEATIKKRSIKKKIRTAKNRIELGTNKHKELKASQGVREGSKVVYKTKAEKEIPLMIEKGELKVKELKKELQ